jgi:hypothetical protein
MFHDRMLNLRKSTLPSLAAAFSLAAAVSLFAEDKGNPIMEEESILKGIKVPHGFEVSVFAAPPNVHYPTCLGAAPTGELFVGVDENGSIDAKGNRGRVVRCIDSNGDGRADKFNVYAEMDSPRGLWFDQNTLYVMHPPFVTAYHDDNGDGVGNEPATPAADGSSASRTYLDESLPGAAPTDEVLLKLLQRKTMLEAEAEDLKIRKAFLSPAEYAKEFERIMIELAQVSHDIRARTKS